MLVPDGRTGAQTETQEIAFKRKENLFYCEGGQASEEVAQRGCGATLEILTTCLDRALAVGHGDTRNPRQQRWQEGVTAAAPCARAPADPGDLGPAKRRPRAAARHARFDASVGRAASGCLRSA